MTTPLMADYIARLRKDLHDEDSSAYRWTDATLQRHIERAVKDFSNACPLQDRTTLQMVADSRDVSVAGLTDLVYLEKVEYPVSQFPVSYVRWTLWGDTLTLLVDEAPGAVEDVCVYWGKIHTLSSSASTIPAPYEEVIATGAGAYAALEWASYATNRVNVGGEDAGQNYLTWGQERMREFQAALRKIDYRSRLRIQQMR